MDVSATCLGRHSPSVAHSTHLQHLLMTPTDARIAAPSAARSAAAVAATANAADHPFAGLMQTVGAAGSDVTMAPKPQPAAASARPQQADVDSHPSSSQQDSNLSQDAAEDMAASSKGSADNSHAEPSTSAADASFISLKLLMFFLHTALQAAEGWGAMTATLPQVTTTLALLLHLCVFLLSQQVLLQQEDVPSWNPN